MIRKRKTIPLKKLYYLAFVFLIVIPFLAALLIALFVLNKQFKRQAIENIERAQDTIVTELISDINVMSMRLSHLIHTNNNEIIDYAAGTDTSDILEKYEYEQQLTQAGSLALEPVKDILSVGFYMKDGRETYIKNKINRGPSQIKEMKWYQAALEHPNTVFVGSFHTKSANDLFHGGKKDLFVLVFALSPNVSTDRSKKLEMVTFYQITGAGETIREYNQNYQRGNNKLGITRVTDEEGNIIFDTTEDQDFPEAEYIRVIIDVKFGNTIWYVESYIRAKELTEEFWSVARMIVLAAVLIFLLAGYYFNYFLQGIINPVAEINHGLKRVEDGELDVHISPQGQFEVRSMIHQFNAMVRRIRALIEEYEEKRRKGEKKPEDYLKELVSGMQMPQRVHEQYPELFGERYVLIGISAGQYPPGQKNMDMAEKLTEGFERNHRFAARCVLYRESVTFFLVLYRISETDVRFQISRMLNELQETTGKEYGVQLSACVGKEMYGWESFMEGLNEIRRKNCLSILLWLTNLFSWIMDYSASKLNVSETDIMIRAKRYIPDHYEDAQLSLSMVAEYVGLNEKYFTNRFTKETGETFSGYLKDLRMQKAQELLRTTSFKIYEISEMVGYHNAEHFTRMFKKVNGVSPAQYRKML